MGPVRTGLSISFSLQTGPVDTQLQVKDVEQEVQGIMQKIQRMEGVQQEVKKEMQQRMEGVQQRMEGVQQEVKKEVQQSMEGVQQDVKEVKEEVQGMKQEIQQVLKQHEPFGGCVSSFMSGIILLN